MTGDLKRTDPALAKALDRLTPPRLPADFADRVMNAAANRVPPQPQTMPPVRRSGRGAWTRGRTILMGAAAFGLVSAAAAATGVFGPITRETPVIGKLVASVAPSLMASPKPAKRSKVASQALHFTKPKPSVAPTEAVVAADPVATVREERAQRIVKRLEERAERRRALGLPPRPLPRKKVRQALRELPPEERQALVDRVRTLRREAKGLPPLDPATRNARRQARLERLQAMSPQERRDRRNRQRERRGLAPLPEGNTLQE